MERRNSWIWITTALVAATLFVMDMTGGADASRSSGDRHEKTIKFWTNSRVAAARDRAFVRDRTTGMFAPSSVAKRVSTTGSRWTAGGDVSSNTGRVFFVMDDSWWTCSASAVQDLVSGRSVVVTAAHCAYDETGTSGFATNWMFVPDYASLHPRFDPDGLFCDDTIHGCWTADALVVSSRYAAAGGFNDTAVLHDYAFAVTGEGGDSMQQLDEVVDPNPVSWTSRTSGADTWMFGYPAGGRYKGDALVYCHGSLGFDARMDDETYRLPCAMTGGSSGGPWLSPFTSTGPTVGTGTVFSVTSYSYGGSKALHGPIFNAETTSMYATALTATSNTLVP